MDAQEYNSLLSIRDIATERLHHLSSRIVLARMNGSSLRDIALEEGLSRSETRQIEREALDKLFADDTIVREDYYKYVYEHYDLDEDYFLSLDNGTLIYYYLKNRYNTGFGTATRAVKDRNLAEDIKESLRNFYNIVEDTETDITENKESQTEETIISSTPVTYDSKQLPEQVIESINELWSIFITSGITKTNEILEQASFFLLLKKLDDDELMNMAESIALGVTPKALYFDSIHQNCRWSNFHNLDSFELYSALTNEAIPFIRNELWVDTNLTVARFIKAIHLKIKDANLLLKVVSCIDSICTRSHINLATVFDELIKKSGLSHITAEFVYKQLDCSINDTICCPFMDSEFDNSTFALNGKTSFADDLNKVWNKSHFNNDMFFSHSTDNSLSLISSMRMFLNDILSPVYEEKNIVVDYCSDTYSRVIASIPAKANINTSDVKNSIKSVIGSSNISLMSMYACHEILSPNGVCGLLVPHKALADTTPSHTKLHEFYLNNVSIIAIVYLPKENKDILIYKNESPATDEVMFAKLENYSIDSIQDIVKPISYDVIRVNKYSLNYLDYFESVSETITAIAVEDYGTVIRRIFDTESKINSIINRIKSMLEELP